MNIRNVAIIAHVDHGKTTLVDKLILQSETVEKHKEWNDLILDNNDLERERGITILSKNIAVTYNNTKINIIDTPGHADFGGEVERVLNMADGVLLLVDAFEGTMPQTRFVLQKALELNLKPIVVINKVDKPNCRPDEVNDEVFELMFSLNASEDQLDYPALYGSAKLGWMSNHWNEPADSVQAVFEAIIQHIPAPKIEEGAAQLLITALDYSSYVGRIAIGKLRRGVIRKDKPVALIKKDGSIIRTRLKELYVFEGLGKRPVQEIQAGDICALVGVEGFDIGDTIADPENPQPLESIKVDEPTMSMLFTINNSPFFGKEGKYITSRHIKERLDLELEKNLALRVEDTASPEAFRVHGRGIMHLSVLIETMRREGYELQVGQPKVLWKEIEGQQCEPVEELYIDLPESFSGKAIEMVTKRKGELLKMSTQHDRSLLVFEIPSRGIMGLRNNILTVTTGEAVMTHRFKDYQPDKGEIERRLNGSLIALETGQVFAYALDKLQDRGRFFVEPQEQVYEGQVVGENNRSGDIVVNLTKSKKLTNVRAAGSDDKAKVAPATKLSLEQALEYIQEDEYVEITPKSIRLRKILLKEHERKRQQNKA
ncbi:MAG: translational GTPase TypA [Bacteroidetes bacterium]|jgi:GTP-binding protein|nr:translational GTPase TypA [Bacteroidota bacterium]